MTKSDYNQIANYAYMQSEINIAIGNQSPRQYLAELGKQCHGAEPKYGGIVDFGDLKANLEESSIPEGIFCMEVAQYRDFLAVRRDLMAQKVRDYYRTL